MQVGGWGGLGGGGPERAPLRTAALVPGLLGAAGAYAIKPHPDASVRADGPPLKRRATTTKPTDPWALRSS